MKKLISVLLICLLLASCVTVVASAKVEKASDLPFVLQPAKTVSMSKVYDGNGTDTQFSYSMEADMIHFMQDCEDPDKKDALFNQLGVSNLWISAQIDWAVDDPTDWHHNEYWDDNEATRYHGLGYDSEGRIRVCEWDYVSVGVEAKSTNDCWITRYAGNPLSSTEDRWNGIDYEDSTHAIGMKDVLKEGQYTVVEDEPGEGHIEIDYSKHTVYSRMRYYVTVWTPVYDELGQEVSTDVKYIFSDWSDAAAYGKDAPKWTPPTAETIKAPNIKDLAETSETFNDYPVVVFYQYVSDKLNEELTEVTSRGGGISLCTEARVKGTSEWKELQGDYDVRDGWNTADILAICGNYEDGTGKPIPKGTQIELRARYWCSIRLEYSGEIVGEFYSPYSDVLTLTFQNDYASDHKPASSETTPAEKPITSLDGSATKTQVDNYVKKLKNDNDPKGTNFGILVSRQKKVAKTSITIAWKKVKNAKSYVVYGNKCGKAYNYKYLATTTKLTYTQKKLKKGTYYKYMVVAFDKKGKSIATAKTLHIATSGGKAGNFKKVTTAAKKDKVTLAKKGKTFKLRAKAVPASKKLKVSVHRKIQYESSNTKIATVSSSGVIKAKKKGKCYVYAYAQSGAYKKITVTVKK